MPQPSCILHFIHNIARLSPDEATKQLDKFIDTWQQLKSNQIALTDLEYECRRNFVNSLVDPKKIDIIQAMSITAELAYYSKSSDALQLALNVILENFGFDQSSFSSRDGFFPELWFNKIARITENKTAWEWLRFCEQHAAENVAKDYTPPGGALIILLAINALSVLPPDERNSFFLKNIKFILSKINTMYDVCYFLSNVPQDIYDTCIKEFSSDEQFMHKIGALPPGFYDIGYVLLTLHNHPKLVTALGGDDKKTLFPITSHNTLIASLVGLSHYQLPQFVQMFGHNPTWIKQFFTREFNPIQNLAQALTELSGKHLEWFMDTVGNDLITDIIKTGREVIQVLENLPPDKYHWFLSIDAIKPKLSYATQFTFKTEDKQILFHKVLKELKSESNTNQSTPSCSSGAPRTSPRF